jgi:O-antigen ligase
MIIFLIFIIGYFYSLQFNRPLDIFSKIFSLQVIFFSLYLIWIKSTSSNNLSLVPGKIVFLFLPYLLIAFNIKKNIILIFVYLLLTTFLVFIAQRGALIALSAFFFYYSLYPLLIKKKFFINLIFFINLLFIFFLIYFYLRFYSDPYLNQLSENIFQKRFDSGRPDIWIEVLELIKQKIWFGYGHEQSSNKIESYILVGENLWRSLSAHSMYLELLLSGGLFGFIIFFIFLYSIWFKFNIAEENYWSRIGSSYIFSMLYFNLTDSSFIQGNIVFTILFWLFIAVALAQIEKKI